MNSQCLFFFNFSCFSLNDYLNELDHEVFNTTSTQPSLSQDENENASALLPNFAQAALLLQNSSGVYSRKVEYLHSLVYKTLHSLIDQTNKHNQSKVKSKNRGDEDIFQFQEFDPDLQFLLLDDVLPIDKDGTKINLKQKEGDEERAVRVDGALQLLEKDNKNANDTDSVNNNNSTVLNTTRLSIGVVIDDQHDSANAAKDAAGNTFNTTLRLMHGACQIHSGTGALLMPGTTTEVTTMESLFQKQNHVHDNNKPMAMDVSMDNGCVGMDDENGGIGFDANGDIDDDYDEDDGNGFVLNQENDAPYSENEQVENQKLNEAASELQDPWKLLLDPHDNSNSKFRPVKVGNTIRLPHDCDELPSDSVTGAGSKRSRKRKKTSSADTKAQAQVEWWDKCIATHSYSTTVAALKKEISAKKRGEDEDDMDSVVDSSSQLFLPLPLQGHLFGNEFLYVAKHQQALKAAQKRKEKQHSNERKGIMAGISEAEVTNERFRDMYEGDDNYEEDGYVDFNYGGADYDDDDDEGANNGVDQRFDNFDEVFSSHDANGDVESKQSTFEELCRAHLRDFAKDAENYAIETGLTKRVSDWQSRLSVILEEEDARPEFNISAYSDRIIAKVDREMKSSRKKKSLGKQKVR